MAHASNFPYKNLGNGPTGKILRPIIPIEIHKRRQSVRYEVLLDTGADISIMSGEIGELLGIDIPSGEPHVITGVGGAVTGGYLHKIGITIPGLPIYNSWAFFSTELNDMQPGILGQQGFFEYFRVSFEYSKRLIVIRSK